MATAQRPTRAHGHRHRRPSRSRGAARRCPVLRASMLGGLKGSEDIVSRTETSMTSPWFLHKTCQSLMAAKQTAAHTAREGGKVQRLTAASRHRPGRAPASRDGPLRGLCFCRLKLARQ